MSCEKPPPLVNGEVIADDETEVGGIATYECFPGYDLKSVDNSSTIICQNLMNSTEVDEDMPPGITDSVNQACEENIRICQLGGSWTGETPECERKQLNSIRVNHMTNTLFCTQLLTVVP